MAEDCVDVAEEGREISLPVVAEAVRGEVRAPSVDVVSFSESTRD